MAKLPSHTPLGLQPCHGDHSGERLWRGDWQIPLLYPFGNHRKPRCFAPGEKKNKLLNGNYSFGKCTEQAHLIKMEKPGIRSPGPKLKGN